MAPGLAMPSAVPIIHDSDRDDWLRERRQGTGSSDSPALLGLVTWASPLSVAADKLDPGDAEERDEFYLRWGRAIEPALLAEYLERTGREGELCGWLYRSTEHLYMQATPDAIVRDEARGFGVVELKSTSRMEQWSDGPPPHVYCQVQHAIAVTGLSWGSAVVIGHGRTFDWVDVERDQAFIGDVLLPACADFWARLRDGRPINPDALDVTKAALARIYPEERDEVVSLGGDWIEKDAERQEIAAQLRALEERKKLIDNELRAAIGSAAAAALPNGVSYTYRTTRRKGYVVEPTSFRQLRRKEAK